MGARLTGFVKAVVVWGLIIAATTMAGATGSLVAAPSAGASSPPAPGTLAVVMSGGQSSVHGNPIGIAFDGAGNLYVVENSNNEVVRIASDGTRTVIAGTGQAGAPTPGPATSSNLNNPFGVAVDASGDIFISDSSNNVIEKVTPDGTLSIVAGTGQLGTPVPGPATSSNLFTPQGIAVDTSGNLYIADHYNQVIEKVTPDGTLSIVAGTGQRGTPVPGPATSSNLHDPEGLAVDAAGNLFIADSGNQMIEKVTPDGTLSIIAGSGDFDAPTPGPATSSGFKYPYGVAPDSSGNVYIADFINDVVEKVTPDGTMTVVAGTGRVGATTPGPATSSDLYLPIDVAVSPSGTLYISDYNNMQIDTVMVRVTSVAISNLPASASYGGSFTPTVSTTGDGTTSVTSSTTSVCTVDPTSGLVSYVGAGTCTLVAHVAAGTNYASADGADQSFSVAAVAPSAPTITSVTRGNAQATITWTDGAANGSSITSQTIYVYEGLTLVTTKTDCSGSPCTVTGLTNGTSYTFKVSDTNHVGEGALSAASSPVTPAIIPAGVPSAPTITWVTRGNAQVTIAWTNGAANGAAITAQTLYVYSGTTLVTTKTNCSGSPCTVTGLTNGTSYTFKVSDTNHVGEGALSAASSAVIPLPAPLLTSVVRGKLSLVPHWSGVTVAHGTVLFFTATAHDLSGNVAGTCTTKSGFGRSCRITGLTGHRTYEVSVTATLRIGAKATGHCALISPPSNQVVGIPLTPVYAGNSGGVVVSWF